MPEPTPEATLEELAEVLRGDGVLDAVRRYADGQLDLTLSVSRRRVRPTVLVTWRAIAAPSPSPPPPPRPPGSPVARAKKGIG